MTHAPHQQAPDPGATDEPGYRGPGRIFQVLLALGFCLAIFPGGFTVHYARQWLSERAGLSAVEQRALYSRKAWFQRNFRCFVDWAEQRLPEDARVLLTPVAFEEESGKARWYLFLNYYLYPRAFFVRRPAWASGTLVDYPKWLLHHSELLDLDGDGRATLEQLLQREEIVEAERLAVAELDLEYELVFAVTRYFNSDYLRLYRLEDGRRVQDLGVPSREEILRLYGQGPGSGDAWSDPELPAEGPADDGQAGGEPR